MKRREFFSKGLMAAAGTALMADSIAKASIQKKTDFLNIIQERKGRPLYFDGMTFFTPGGSVHEAGLSGLVWDVSKGAMIDGKFIRQMKPTMKSMVQARKFLANNDEGFFLATKGSQIKQAHESGRIAVFLQSQSLESVSEDLEMMDVFYELGQRVQQITHHYGNAYSGGCLVKEFTGLTPLGFKAMEKMNGLGMIPDISHGNEVMGLDVVKASKKPVIISHTGARALVNNARCAPDSLIRGVAETGGVVGIFSMSFWLTEDPVPTVDSYIKQLEQVIKVGGIDAVGISNDYDAAGVPLKTSLAEAAKGYYPWWKQHEGILGFEKLPKHHVIPELNNVKRFYTIQAALEKKGYTEAQIEKIMGGNWVRVYTESLG